MSKSKVVLSTVAFCLGQVLPAALSPSWATDRSFEDYFKVKAALAPTVGDWIAAAYQEEQDHYGLDQALEEAVTLTACDGPSIAMPGFSHPTPFGDDHPANADDEIPQSLIGIAFRSLEIEARLSTGSFAEYEIEDLILEYENEMIRLMLSGTGDFLTNDRLVTSKIAQSATIISRLSEWQSALTLPYPIVCSGDRGGIVTHFVTDPDGASVTIIPAGYIDVCKAVPLIDSVVDTTQCPGWMYVLPGEYYRMIGVYIIRARWPDGSTLEIETSYDYLQDHTGTTSLVRH